MPPGMACPAPDHGDDPAGRAQAGGNQLRHRGAWQHGRAGRLGATALGRDRVPARARQRPPLRTPASIEAASRSLPDWPGGADLVIVTVPQFRDALKPLVEARTKQGLRVAVLDAEQVYDVFSYGRTVRASRR